MLLAGPESLVAHAALTNDAAQAVVADNVGLVRLFADRRRRPGGGDLPRAIRILQHHRSAVVNNPVAEVYLGR